MFSLKALLVAATLSAGLAGAAPVVAATVNVSAQHSSIFGDASGHRQWKIKANYTNGVETRKGISAGAFRLKADYGKGDVREFLAFCLSPFEWLSLPKTYTVGTDLSPTVVNRLSALANGAWSLLNSATKAGAFQLAAWEIVSESKKNPLKLNDGKFRVTYASKASSLTFAQQWLDAVTNGTGAFTALPRESVILSATHTQDLLTKDLPAPVPLPGTLGFLAFGLAALTAKSRARRI